MRVYVCVCVCDLFRLFVCLTDILLAYYFAVFDHKSFVVVCTLMLSFVYFFV